MGKKKPWLRYHKDGAPVREFQAPPKKPRELFWARFWLIMGSHIGAHRFYLWKTKSAVRWLIGFQLSAFVLTFIAIIIEEEFSPKHGHILHGVALLVWIVIVIFEYRRLRDMVIKANQDEFGRKAIYDKNMQGEIGPYSAMRPVSYLVGLALISLFLVGNFMSNIFAENVLIILLFISVATWLIQLARVKKSMKANN